MQQTIASKLTLVFSHRSARPRRRAGLREELENTSNTPERLSRQNRFQMLFQLPNSAGSARQVMLCTVK